MKLVFELYLIYLVMRIYKATLYNLGQNLLETFRVYVFLTFSSVHFLPTHGELV